jgi:hypothetical protein
MQHEPEYYGEERRGQVNDDQLSPVQKAIVKMEIMTGKFETLEKNMTTFISDMKENQVKYTHQARQDYEYLDTKIDKKSDEVKSIAYAALKKVDDHLLLTQNDKEHKKSGVDWVRWVPSFIFGLIAAIALIWSKM